MSDFVNYHKRDVQLPSGCHDLIDVLNLQEPTVAPQRVRFFDGELAQIAGYVARLLSSPNLPNALCIRTEALAGLWLHYRTKHGPLELQMTVRWTEVEKVQAVRELFVVRGFGANKEYLSEGRYHFAYKVEATLAPQLVIDLLKTAYGLKAEARVRFIFNH